MSTAVETTSLLVHRFKFSGQTLKEAIVENWDAIVRVIPGGIGNAAGYKLHSVHVDVEKLYRADGAYHTLKTDDDKWQKGSLVIRHTGQDLAHKPASKQIERIEVPIDVPVGTEPFVVDLRGQCEPDWKVYAIRLCEALKAHAHAASKDTNDLISEFESIKHVD